MRRLTALIAYPADERRATMAGINLFFSALLGANLGAMNDLPLGDYLRLIVMLLGAVTGLLTVAVSRRPIVVWSTAASLLVILGCIALVPDFGPEAGREQMERLLVTIGVWLAALVILRLTPSLESGEAPETLLDEDDELAPAPPEQPR